MAKGKCYKVLARNYEEALRKATKRLRKTMPDNVSYSKNSTVPISGQNIYNYGKFQVCFSKKHIWTDKELRGEKK